MNFSESPNLWLNIIISVRFCIHFSVFFEFCIFWYNHIELCEISEKFSLTNHLRLVRKVPAPGKILMGGEKWNYQNRPYYATIVAISCDLIQFMWYFDFFMFWYNQIELCEISKKFSLTNNLRLVRKVPAPGKTLMGGGKLISQNHIYYVNHCQ